VGFMISADELQQAQAARGEVSDEELDWVAGGQLGASTVPGLQLTRKGPAPIGTTPQCCRPSLSRLPCNL
jgi:hypothetical protein